MVVLGREWWVGGMMVMVLQWFGEVRCGDDLGDGCVVV